MAEEKVLQTRIVNKHADLSTWNSSTLVLKEGEIALAKSATRLLDGGDETIFIAKIGNGGTFADSPYLFAKASDVYNWAKAETKPDYTAAEIARGESTVDADLTTIEGDIVSLKTAVGDSGAVAAAIKAAIEALDVEDVAVEKQFVTAVAEADGKITVTRRELTADDIPALEIAKITGLQAELNAKATKTELTQAVTNLEAEIDDLAGEGRTTETVKSNADAIAQLKVDLGNVTNVMNFRGVSADGEGTTPGHDIVDPKAGDVIIYGAAEYVYDETGSWVKFGDASDNATAIAELQQKNDTQDEAITAAQSQADKGVADAKTANDAIAIINGTAEQDGSIAKAVEDAKTELKTYADTAEADALRDAKAYTDALGQTVTNNGTEITTIKNTFARVKTTVSGDVTTNELVVGQGDEEFVLVFDCGGAE